MATERNCKQSRGGEGRDCSHMIPRRPTDDVVCPQPSAIAAGRINGRERVVSRHVEKHCYQDCPDQIEKAADEQINCVGSLPPSQRRDCQEDAARRCSKENSEEQGIDHHDIDGLHGGDTVRRRKTRQRLHHERRKSEEHSPRLAHNQVPTKTLEWRSVYLSFVEFISRGRVGASQMGRLRLRDLAAQILRCQLRNQSTKLASSTVLIHIKLGKEERDISRFCH